jgi:hypothetical protein
MITDKYNLLKICLDNAINKLVRNRKTADRLTNEAGKVIKEAREAHAKATAAQTAALDSAQELFEFGFKMPQEAAIELWRTMAEFWPPANKELNKIFGVDE